MNMDINQQAAAASVRTGLVGALLLQHLPRSFSPEAAGQASLTASNNSPSLTFSKTVFKTESLTNHDIRFLGSTLEEDGRSVDAERIEDGGSPAMEPHNTTGSIRDIVLDVTYAEGADKVTLESGS